MRGLYSFVVLVVVMLCEVKWLKLLYVFNLLKVILLYLGVCGLI